MACMLPENSFPLSVNPNFGSVEERCVPNPCGSSSFLSLPDDVVALVSRSLNPIDLCNLSLCCRSLNGLADTDKVWFMQCEKLASIDTPDLLSWRMVVDSYKALYKFLIKVKPLIGIWVHQNPELGNVVYVMWGFMSAVGCRIIPQELGPLGFEGPLLWAPVFEVVGDSDGSPLFFLHGRERDRDYCYPGSVKGIDQQCNVLLLEAEPRKAVATNAVRPNVDDLNMPREIYTSKESGSHSSCREEMNDLVPFSKLAFGDRRKLLELVADHVRLEMPESANGPLFPRSKDAPNKEDELPMTKESTEEDFLLLARRRLFLIEMYRFGNNTERQTNSGSGRGAAQLDSGSGNRCDATGLLKASWQRSGVDCTNRYKDRSNSLCSISRHLSFEENAISNNMKRRSIAGYFKNGFKQIMGKATGSTNGSNNTRCCSSNTESKKVQLYEFLRLGTTVGLSLRASTMRLSTYHAWPIMRDNRFALYKLPQPLPVVSQEFAGLWGGAFGWPPGRPTEDKPGKALFFLLLSYEESELGKHLIATKILEGTHYVLHPNGSAMFIANMNEPSSDPFPWDTDEQSLPIAVEHAYNGEGIANGYGFRYPGSKPGTFFALQTGLLAFVWRDTRAVLMLQRLNLQTLLGRGERVSSLPPVANFAYLTKSYSNVFVGFAGTHSLSFPR